MKYMLLITQGEWFVKSTEAERARAMEAGMDRSPVVALNRAIAISHVNGPEAALREVESIAEPLERYYLLHATRAVLLRLLGRTEEADVADAQAIALTSNKAERELTARRLGRP